MIGGSGLIGSKLVTKLREHGHEAVAAFPSGVNTLTARTGRALKGASGSLTYRTLPRGKTRCDEFFETSTRNLLAYEAAAGVDSRALSVVGSERLLESATSVQKSLRRI